MWLDGAERVVFACTASGRPALVGVLELRTPAAL